MFIVCINVPAFSLTSFETLAWNHATKIVNLHEIL